MILIEKMLFTINHLSIYTAEAYFKEEGFVLQSCIDNDWLFVKPIRTDKVETLSLEQAGNGFIMIRHAFHDEEHYKAFSYEAATTKFGFKILEDEEAKVLGKDDLILILMRHEYPPHKAFSIKLGRQNKENKVITQVVMNPPTS